MCLRAAQCFDGNDREDFQRRWLSGQGGQGSGTVVARADANMQSHGWQDDEEYVSCTARLLTWHEILEVNVVVGIPPVCEGGKTMMNTRGSTPCQAANVPCYVDRPKYVNVIKSSKA